MQKSNHFLYLFQDHTRLDPPRAIRFLHLQTMIADPNFETLSKTDRMGLEHVMKLHLRNFWHRGPHYSPGVNGRSASPGIDIPPSKMENALYAAILIVGVPAVVGATTFVVRHLYDGLLWLLPN